MQAGHEVVHLLGGGQRALVQDVEPPLAGIGLLSLREMKLQCGGLDASLAQFLSCRLVGAKPSTAIAVRLCSLADHGQRGGLPCSGNSIQANDLFMAGEDLFRCPSAAQN